MCGRARFLTEEEEDAATRAKLPVHELSIYESNTADAGTTELGAGPPVKMNSSNDGIMAASEGECRSTAEDVAQLLTACGCHLNVHHMRTGCTYPDPACMDGVGIAVLCCTGGKVGCLLDFL